MFKRAAAAVGIAVGILAVMVGLIFFQGLTDAATEDKDPTAQVHDLEQDSINGNGLEGDQTLSQVRTAETDDIVFFEDRVVRHFRYDTQDLSQFGAAMAGLRAACPDVEDIYVMPAPDRVLMEQGFEKDQDRYQSFIKRLTREVDGDAVVVDAWPTLSRHTDEYIFYLTESCWSARGAYYGAAALCEAMGIEPLPLDAYEEHMYETFKGVLYVSAKQAYAAAHGEAAAEADVNIDGDSAFYYILPESRNVEKCFQEDGRCLTEPVFSKARQARSMFISDGGYTYAILPGDEEAEALEDEAVLFLCDNDGRVLAPYLANYCETLYVVNLENKETFYTSLVDLVRKHHIKKIVLSQTPSEMGVFSASGLIKALAE